VRSQLGRAGGDGREGGRASERVETEGREGGQLMGGEGDAREGRV
jgi:hypothetical protein